MKEKIIVIYNAKFDLRMLPLSILKNIDITFCCMLEFAKINGEWDDRFNGYKWVPLGEAASKVGHKWKGEKHRALSDTLACRDVWHHICFP